MAEVYRSGQLCVTGGSIIVMEEKEKYLDALTSCVRDKRLREQVYKEYRNHIEEQTEAYVQAGWRSEDAERQALINLGNPVMLGRAMNQVHHPSPHVGVLLLSVITLIVLFHSSVRSLLDLPTFLLVSGIGILLYLGVPRLRHSHRSMQLSVCFIWSALLIAVITIIQFSYINSWPTESLLMLISLTFIYGVIAYIVAAVYQSGGSYEA